MARYVEVACFFYPPGYEKVIPQLLDHDLCCMFSVSGGFPTRGGRGASLMGSKTKNPDFIHIPNSVMIEAFCEFCEQFGRVYSG